MFQNYPSPIILEQNFGGSKRFFEVRLPNFSQIVKTYDSGIVSQKIFSGAVIVKNEKCV